MKPIKFFILSIVLFISATLFAQTTETEKIKVYGNCSICKKNIESASKITGVTGSDWNKKTGWLTISYDPGKISNRQIQKSIAAAGYDTEDFKGDDKAYNDLDECCQYDRKSMAIEKKNN